MGKSWKNPIKEAMAQKKGALFTKLAREIAVAAKLGGPDPEANSRLKLAVAAAREVSCPKDTIERAIKKGSGQLDDGEQIEELTYEGYGPHGVGVIVECQTDNKNRTVSEIRSLFKYHGGNMGETGAVMWMFDRVSWIEALTNKALGSFDPEEEAIEVGANEVEAPAGEDSDSDKDQGIFSFYGAPEDLDSIRSSLSERGWQIRKAELSFKPKNITDLSEEQKQEVVALLEELEDNEDSHRVYATIN